MGAKAAWRKYGEDYKMEAQMDGNARRMERKGEKTSQRRED